MQPPSNSAIEAAFAADLIDWFDPTMVSMLRGYACRWIAEGKARLDAEKAGGASGAGTPPARPPIEPHYVGACWVALMASRELVDDRAAHGWWQRRH